MRIIITGTPGVGKTALSDGLARELKCEVVHVNYLVKQEKLYSKIVRGEYVADFKKLKVALQKKLENKNIIVESHLLCDLALPATIVVVLRCDPFELEKRLYARKYPKEKLKSNLLCEILDYCEINAIKNYGKRKVMQIVTTRRVSAKTLLEKMLIFRETPEPLEVRWLKKISGTRLESLLAPQIP